VRKACAALVEHARLLAFVYDATHAPHSAPFLPVEGTVFLPMRRGGRTRSCGDVSTEVSYLGAGGGGARRTVEVRVQLRAVALQLAFKW
jgi:hypothetical protein